LVIEDTDSPSCLVDYDISNFQMLTISSGKIS